MSASQSTPRPNHCGARAGGRDGSRGSMICPECAAAGETSKVYPRGGFSTAMYCQPFYDEAGKYHHHDVNTHTEGYTCSNGHSWSVKHDNTCWCGWPAEEEAMTPNPGSPEAIKAGCHPYAR